MADTTDIADMGRTTIQVPEELADELHDKKNRGDSYADVIYRLIEEAGGSESSHEPEPTTTAPETEAPTVDRERLKEEVPGSGELADTRADIVLDMYDVLRKQGTAEKSDMLEVVDIEEAGYASEDSVWSNMVKGRDTLRSLPGVAKPESGRTEWRYTE